MRELRLQNEEIKHNSIIHQQNLIGKALRHNQVMAYLFSTFNFTSSLRRNFRLLKAFLDEIQSECAALFGYSEVLRLSKAKVLRHFS
jgi:hypothetical protein